MHLKTLRANLSPFSQGSLIPGSSVAGEFKLLASSDSPPVIIILCKWLQHLFSEFKAGKKENLVLVYGAADSLNTKKA